MAMITAIIVVISSILALQSVATFNAVNELTTWSTLTVSAIACPSPGRCVAVGNENDSSEPSPIVMSFNQGVWSPPRRVGPQIDTKDGVSSAPLFHVSCANVDNCIADGYAVKGYTTIPVVLTLHDHQWSSPRGPLFARPKGQYVEAVRMTGCSSTGQCWAVVQVVSSRGLYSYVVGESHGTWLPPHLLGAAYDNNAHDTTTYIVGGGPSCVGSSCTFYGYVESRPTKATKSATDFDFLESTVGASWRPPARAPNLQSPFGFTIGVTNAPFSCAQLDTCLVGGVVRNGSPSKLSGAIDQEIDGHWFPPTTGIGAASPTEQSSVERLDCASTALCVASGEAQGHGDESIFVQAEVKGHWLSPLMIPTKSPWTGGQDQLSGPGDVVCQTASSCYVTGSFVESPNQSSDFVARFLNGSWTYKIVDLGHGTDPAQIFGVSCNPESCWAVAGPTSNSTGPDADDSYAFRILSVEPVSIS